MRRPLAAKKVTQKQTTGDWGGISMSPDSPVTEVQIHHATRAGEFRAEPAHARHAKRIWSNVMGMKTSNKRSIAMVRQAYSAQIR